VNQLVDKRLWWHQKWLLISGCDASQLAHTYQTTRCHTQEETVIISNLITNQSTTLRHKTSVGSVSTWYPAGSSVIFWRISSHRSTPITNCTRQLANEPMQENKEKFERNFYNEFLVRLYEILNCVSYITENAKINKIDAMATRADKTCGSLQFPFPVYHASFKSLTVSNQSYHLCIPQLHRSSLQSPTCQNKMSKLELVCLETLCFWFCIQLPMKDS